jgi:hypothetical protein
MQRHWYQQVRGLEHFAPGARHPAAHGGREIGAVLVFQRMHQRACDLVKAYRGARAGRGGLAIASIDNNSGPGS